MALHDKNKPKKKRWWGGVFSCCGDTNVYDLDGDNKEFARKLVRKRGLSRISRKKRTVPIEISASTTTMDNCETTTRSNSDGSKENNCNRQNEPEECSDQIGTQKRPKSILSSKSANAAATVPVHDLDSGNDYLSKSAPLCRTIDLVQTQTKLYTSNCDSPQSSRYVTPDSSPRVLDADSGVTEETDCSKLVPILTVAALLVLLFGRGFAVFSMCIYFYIVSRLQAKSTENKDQMKMGNEELDLNSAMHKKTVVLRGFLERRKKKPATNLQSSSS